MTSEERQRLCAALMEPGPDNVVPAGYVDRLAHMTDEQVQQAFDRLRLMTGPRPFQSFTGPVKAPPIPTGTDQEE